MLFILDVFQKTVGVASNSSPEGLHYFGDSHIENLDGVSTYEFSVQAKHELANTLEVNGHIIFKDYDGKFLLFTIKEITDEYQDGVQIRHVMCENTATTELLGDVVRPMSLPSSSLENSLASILANSTSWSIGEVDFTGSWDFEIDEYMTVLEALQKLAENYNCELYYTVELEGNTLVNKKVNVVEQRGNITQVRFDYSINLRGVSRTTNSEQIITAIVPVGKGDDQGNRLTVKDVATYTGEDFFHTIGTDWIGSKSALERWGKDGKHIFGVAVLDEAETPAELNEKGQKELEKRINPAMIYSCSVSSFETLTGYEAQKIRVGDTVTVKDWTFDPPIAITARIQELNRSYTDPNSDDVALGDYQAITLGDSPAIKSLQAKITKNEAKWNTGGLSEEEIGTIVEDKAGAMVDEAVSDITVGGVNILDNADFKKTPTAWNSASLAVVSGAYPNSITVTRGTGYNSYGFTLYGTETLKAGKEYTISFEALTDGTFANFEYMYVRGTGVANYHLPNIAVDVTKTTDYVKYSLTFIPTVDYPNGGILFGTSNGSGAPFQLRKPKLEEGKLATAWTRSTNDVNSDITDAKASGDAANTTLTNQKVGGRNLLNNSDFYTGDLTGWSNWNTATRTVKDITDLPGFTKAVEITVTGTNQGILQSVPAIADQEYMVSGWIKAISGRGVLQGYDGVSQYPSVSTATTDVGVWKRFSVKVVAKGATIQIQIGRNGSGGANGTYQYTGLQVEQGNVVTDWSPSTKDADAKLGYKIEVHSSNGMQFVNGTTKSILTCVVYQGKTNITSTLPASKFVWKKYDEDGTLNQTWTNAHANVGYMIEIDRADVDKKATFICDVLK